MHFSGCHGRTGSHLSIACSALLIEKSESMLAIGLLCCVKVAGDRMHSCCWKWHFWLFVTAWVPDFLNSIERLCESQYIYIYISNIYDHILKIVIPFLFIFVELKAFIKTYKKDAENTEVSFPAHYGSADC